MSLGKRGVIFLIIVVAKYKVERAVIVDLTDLNAETSDRTIGLEPLKSEVLAFLHKQPQLGTRRIVQGIQELEGPAVHLQKSIVGIALKS